MHFKKDELNSITELLINLTISINHYRNRKISIYPKIRNYHPIHD